MSGRESRLERLQAVLAAESLDAAIVTNLANVRYLTGYAGSNGLVLVTGAGAVFVTDFRYANATREIAELMDVRTADRDLIVYVAAHLPELVAQPARIGFEAAHLPVARHTVLAAAPGAEMVPTTGLVERLRAVKDPDEVDAIRTAAALIAPVLETIAGEGLVGRREVDVAWRVRELFHESGAERPAFDTIVAAGPRAATPHAEPSEAAIGADTLVIVDLGCMLHGYASDCTRTFATGDPPAELREIYEVCRRAQAAGLEAIRPGVSGYDADAAGRDVIVAAGYGERFGHSLGHGVGLEVHEAPRLAVTSEATLVPGTVVTVEPGIYLPARGGVRIEDLVVVTDDGCERLTPFPKELRVVG
jgi:Xaa-Pro aminopeptidase